MPRPSLQAMVLADQIYQDRSTGKFIIAGTFRGVLLGQQNTIPASSDSAVTDGRQFVGSVIRSGSPYLYIALVDVHGEVPLDLKFVDLSDASVLLEAQFVVVAVDPVSVAEYCVPMPPLPITKVGSYSLDLLYDNEILGAWRVVVKGFAEQPGDAKESS